MLSLNYENINYVMTQILKLSCASFSYVNISYVLATFKYLKITSEIYCPDLTNGEVARAIISQRVKLALQPPHLSIYLTVCILHSHCTSKNHEDSVI